MPLSFATVLMSFIAATGQVDQNHLVFAHFRRIGDCPSNGVTGFQRRNNALETAEQIKGFECFVIFGNSVFHAVDVVQMAVFRADAWVIQACGNRVRTQNLAVFVLHQIAAETVQVRR